MSYYKWMCRTLIQRAFQGRRFEFLISMLLQQKRIPKGEKLSALFPREWFRYGITRF